MWHGRGMGMNSLKYFSMKRAFTFWLYIWNVLLDFIPAILCSEIKEDRVSTINLLLSTLTAKVWYTLETCVVSCFLFYSLLKSVLQWFLTQCSVLRAAGSVLLQCVTDNKCWRLVSWLCYCLRIENREAGIAERWESWFSGGCLSCALSPSEHGPASFMGCFCCLWSSCT